MQQRSVNNRLRFGAQPARSADPSEVARVAYELYEQRGREDGRDLEDWLKAEVTVRERSFART